MDLSLIVACYNEEPVLEESVSQIIEILDSTIWSYEILFVDDCSQDRTRELILDLIRRYPGKNLRYLFHPVNRGRGQTVTDGIRQVKGEYVGYIDIDLEVHARYIPSMLLALQQGADIASAFRVYKVGPLLFHRFILSRGYANLMRFFLDVDLQDTEAGFKFFRRERIIPVLNQTRDEGWFWDTEIMVLANILGYQIIEIPCLFIKRYDKKSSVRVIHDTIEYFFKLWSFRSVIKKMQIAPRVREDTRLVKE